MLMVVNNRTAPKMETKDWGEVYPQGIKNGATVGEDGRITEFVNAATTWKFVEGTGFASGSTPKDHISDPENRMTVRVSGMFDGASGTYVCPASADSCISSRTSENHIRLSGGWTFEPAENAMVVEETPDNKYVEFGWWLDEEPEGVKTLKVTTFVAPNGALAATDVEDLTRTATYKGTAVGKAAVYAPGKNVSGAFVANATLMADFDADADASTDENDTNGTISGMIDGFMVGGEPQDDWSVELKAAGLNNAGTFGSASTMTVWTMGDDKGTESGSWSGGFYEQSSVGELPAPPSIAAGSFVSEYENIGHMVGAFGECPETIATYEVAVNYGF